ncbi:hypothetical protein Acr_12g0005030 [Actinidia rufa]|uniref:DUF659 domain-containing protein n=1 Tax=Actinidia rufa TaxID=165716 RepID=A0A7J0FGY3_9ERIC|nr:hypothetical protein Acr_12g0005030 [Actinidia rufa]
MRLPCHNVEGCSTISDEVLEVIKKEYEAAEAKKAELALNARKKAEPLVNIMAASSGGSMFIKAIDASENTKDAEYVANLFVQTIKDLREANVIQIVTDNASNYKATGLTIETKYPHVFWTLCVVHSLNLAMKSICEPGEKSPQYTQCKWISDLVKQMQDIRNFVLNHHGMHLPLAVRGNWSTYSMIQSVKRNRLATSRAKDLVFVHCNLRLLSRKSKEYTEWPSKYWDISGDQFDIDRQEMIELAQLSLDEPELEGITFQDVEESEEQLNGDEC